MRKSSGICACRARYELRFASLFDSGRGFDFPCDTRGHVDIGALSERGRCNYYYARAVNGREFLPPTVAVVEHTDECPFKSDPARAKPGAAGPRDPAAGGPDKSLLP